MTATNNDGHMMVDDGHSNDSNQPRGLGSCFLLRPQRSGTYTILAAIIVIISRRGLWPSFLGAVIAVA